MPFDVLPQETKTRFQAFADAMLRGCAVSRAARVLHDGDRRCALGALLLGMGRDAPDSNSLRCRPEFSDIRDLCDAYEARYRTSIITDNDSLGLTREQIAARIAAL